MDLKKSLGHCAALSFIYYSPVFAYLFFFLQILKSFCLLAIDTLHTVEACVPLAKEEKERDIKHKDRRFL